MVTSKIASSPTHKHSWRQKGLTFWISSLQHIGAEEAGQRRPIALLPTVRVWAAWQKPRIMDWRERCIFKGETPVGRGALDEAFTLAHEVERATLEGVPFAAVASACYL
eukprot:1496783-Amphidinium_carterae.1